LCVFCWWCPVRWVCALSKRSDALVRSTIVECCGVVGLVRYICHLWHFVQSAFFLIQVILFWDVFKYILSVFCHAQYTQNCAYACATDTSMVYLDVTSLLCRSHCVCHKNMPLISPEYFSQWFSSLKRLEFFANPYTFFDLRGWAMS
jgi:hypothetical protein